MGEGGVEPVGGLEQVVGGVEAPQLVQGDGGVVQQDGLARLFLERGDRGGGDRDEQLCDLGLRGGLAGGGQALLDQQHTRVVTGMAVLVLGGAVEQRLVTVEVVEGQLQAGLVAQLGAERAALSGSRGGRLRGGRDSQPGGACGSGSGRAGVIGRGDAGKAKGHSREPPSEGEAPSFIGRVAARL